MVVAKRDEEIQVSNQDEGERRESERRERAFTEQDMLRFRTGPGVEPEKVPPAQPGDGWIILGLLVGAVAGAALGWLVAEWLGFNQFIGVVAGVLVGAIIGTLVGDGVKKYVARRRRQV